MPSASAHLIRLAEPDNVLVVSATMSEGTTVEIGGCAVTLPKRLALGHKLAARDIRCGETILKYDFPIGVATEDIALGEHVHVHNMRSGYTQTYTIPSD